MRQSNPNVCKLLTKNNNGEFSKWSVSVFWQVFLCHDRKAFWYGPILVYTVMEEIRVDWRCRGTREAKLSFIRSYHQHTGPNYILPSWKRAPSGRKWIWRAQIISHQPCCWLVNKGSYDRSLKEWKHETTRIKFVSKVNRIYLVNFNRVS